MKSVFFLALMASVGLIASDRERPAVSRQTLDAPRTIEGYPCDRGYAWFFDDGRLSSCKVSVETGFGELRVPKASMIHLTPAGKPLFVFLGRDSIVRGMTCRGGGHSYMTAMYPSGKLRVCWLAGDQEVAGVPCGGASFFTDVFGGGAGTVFHENGRLKTCRLSKDQTVQGRRFASGDHPVFDENGKLATDGRGLD